MSMELAYCKELNRNLYIDEARLEFNKKQYQYNEFNFFCSDPDCVQFNGERTQIVATHYKTPPSEATSQIPNFRLFPGQRHSCQCVWIIEQDLAKLPQQPDESQEQYQQRIIKSKLLHRIDIFIRPNHKKVKEGYSQLVDDSSRAITQYEINQTGSRQYKGNRVKTTLRSTGLLENLVTFYLINSELKKQGKLTEDEFKKIQFYIKGDKSYYLAYFFRRMENVWDRLDYNGVYIAKINKVIRYKLGFKLFFYKKINNKTVSLYIDPSLMEASKYRNNFDYILKEFVNHKERGMKAYFLSAHFEERENSINVIIPNLQFLSLRLTN